MHEETAPRDERVIEYQARAAMLQPVPLALLEPKAQRRTPSEEGVTSPIVDQSIEDSFPASDPPSWTAGIVRPAPLRVARKRAGRAVVSLAKEAFERVAALFGTNACE